MHLSLIFISMSFNLFNLIKLSTNYPHSQPQSHQSNPHSSSQHPLRTPINLLKLSTKYSHTSPQSYQSSHTPTHHSYPHTNLINLFLPIFLFLNNMILNFEGVISVSMHEVNTTRILCKTSYHNQLVK
jgi:hypothetical protein